MKYGNRSVWKRIVRSPATFVVVLIAFIFVGRSAWSMYDKANLSKSRLEQAAVTLAELDAHDKSLSEKVAYLSTEQGVESEIRTKFLAAQEGESVAVIVGDTKPVNDLQASSTMVRVSWWRRVLRMIGL